jgi:hypothetical protein
MPIDCVDTDTEQSDDGVARLTMLVAELPPQPLTRHAIDAAANLRQAAIND